MWPGFFRMVPEYLSGHLIYRFQHAVQKLLLRELPRSMRTSSVSQPEVREASATFIPRTVSYKRRPLGVGMMYLPE